MRSTTSPKSDFPFAMLILELTLIVALAAGQGGQIQQSRTDKQGSSKEQEQIHIPNRPANPLFKGAQGKQKTEIHFDPATRMVTMKLLVQGPNGYFIPNIRRENFVVYENGVRQQITAVDVENSP